MHGKRASVAQEGGAARRVHGKRASGAQEGGRPSSQLLVREEAQCSPGGVVGVVPGGRVGHRGGAVVHEVVVVQEVADHLRHRETERDRERQRETERDRAPLTSDLSRFQIQSSDD